MANAILSFLLSIVISLGGSVTADNIGQDFATIYSNQDPSVQKKMDQYLFDPGGQLIRDITLEGTKLTTEMLYDIQSGKVSSKVINDSIGYESWNDFVNNNQANVAGFGKTISTTDGYTLRFYVDRHPNYDPVTGKFNQYVVWYDVTDPDGNIVKRDYDVTQAIYGFNDEIDAVNALGNSYIDKDGKLHFLSYNGKELALVDCANLFPAGTSGQFTPVAFGDGTIGQITDATIAGTQIGQLAIAADGSITLPDGTKVYPNSDGTYTIDNSVYSPTYNIGAYDDSALLGLLQQLLTRIDELENKLEFEKDIATDEELETKLEEAVDEAQSYEGSLSEFMLDSAITKVFPFCLPFDFVRGIKLFNASPQTPIFTYYIKIPSVGTFQGTEIEIKIDFSYFETLASISRWVSTVGFAFSLIFVSTKIVKGAGA